MTQGALQEAGKVSPYKEKEGVTDLPVEWLKEFKLPGIIDPTPLSVADSFTFVFGQVH